MSIRDDHGNANQKQLTPKSDDKHTSDFGHVGQTSSEFLRINPKDLGENPLVVGSSSLETQGESPKCMYHLMSPTVAAKTPVDPRFSSEKPPRVRMILPELNRGTNCIMLFKCQLNY